MKISWVTFSITLFLAIIYTNISGDTSSIAYYICYMMTGIAMFITLVSELHLSTQWFIPIWIVLLIQAAGFAYLMYITRGGQDLSVSSKIPMLSVNPDNYQGIAQFLFHNVGDSNGLTYSYWLSVIYRLTGLQMGTGIMLSILFSWSAIAVFVKTIRYYDSALINKLPFNVSLFYLLFYPQMISESLQVHREAFIIFCLSLSLYFFVRWWRERKTNLVILSIFACLPAAYMHAGSIFLAVGISVIYICYLNNPEKVVINVKSFFALLFVICLSIFIFNNMDLKKFENRNVETIALNNSGRMGDGGSAYQAGIPISNPVVAALINTPIKSFYFIGAPLPTYWRNPVDILTFLLSSLFYLIPIFAGLYQKIITRKLKQNFLFVVIAVILIFTIPFAWGVSNSGTAVRHRTKVVIWLAFAIVLLIRELQLKRQEKVLNCLAQNSKK